MQHTQYKNLSSRTSSLSSRRDNKVYTAISVWGKGAGGPNQSRVLLTVHNREEGGGCVCINIQYTGASQRGEGG